MNNISITLAELANIEELSALAKYSIVAEKAVREKYSKELEEAGHDIRVYDRMVDEYSGAGYLTTDWVFKYYDSWNPSEVFELPVTAEDIFSVLKADFYKKTAQDEFLSEQDTSKIKHAFFVREWIEKVKMT